MPFAKLDATRLHMGLETLLTAGTDERAAELGVRLRAEQPAAAIAVDLLERLDSSSHRDGPALSG